MLHLLPVELETHATVVFRIILSATVSSFNFRCFSNCENYNSKHIDSVNTSISERKHNLEKEHDAWMLVVRVLTDLGKG